MAALDPYSHRCPFQQTTESALLFFRSVLSLFASTVSRFFLSIFSIRMLTHRLCELVFAARCTDGYSSFFFSLFGFVQVAQRFRFDLSESRNRKERITTQKKTKIYHDRVQNEYTQLTASLLYTFVCDI